MANNIVNGYELIPGADLHGANLQGSDLDGANLQGADLHGANLQGADLAGANLRHANLQGANLQGATLRLADLTGADLTGAILYSTDLSVANLTGANLTGADLEGVFFMNANLTGANLTDANLTGAHIDGAIFQDAILNGPNLELVQVAARPRPPPAPIEGRAYEIHNAWNALNIDDITRFLQEFNTSNATVNEKTIDLIALPFKTRINIIESLPTTLINKVIKYIEKYKTLSNDREYITFLFEYKYPLEKLKNFFVPQIT